MRALMVSVLAVAVSGCTFGIKTCTDTSECNPGSTCEEGFCVAPPDSGTGGGSTGGGAGGGTTGGGGGTTTGGGMGGGGGSVTGGGGGGGDPMCPTMNCEEACIEGTGCVPFFSGIQIISPDAGTRLREGTVGLAVELVATNGVVVEAADYPESLSYSIADGGVVDLPRQGLTSQYRTQYATTSCGNGRVLDWTVALQDGGLATSSSFECDGEAGSFIAPVFPAAPAVKRDSRILFEMNATEPLVGVSVRLDGELMESSTLGLDGGACAAFGGCWFADFSKPSMPAVSATMVLTADGTDRVGFPATLAGVAIPVTRERWSVRLGGANEILAAPAVGPDGFVYVGDVDSSTAGSLHRLDPVTGAGHDAGVPIGAVQGVAVSRATVDDAGVSLVFVAYNDTSRGYVSALSSSLSGTGLQLPCGASGADRVRVAPALVHLSSGRVAAVSVSTGARAIRWETQDGCSFLPNSGISTPASPHPRPTNAVVVNSALDAGAVFIDENSLGHSLVAIDGVKDSTLRLGSRAALDAGGLGAPSQTVLLGDSLVTNLLALDGTGVNRANPAIGPSARWNGSSSLGMVAVASNTEAYVGTGAEIARFSPTSGGSSLAGLSVGGASGQTFPTAPVLLAAPQGSAAAWGYAVSENAKLVAFPLAGSTATSWSADLRTSEQVYAHPGFGCNSRVDAAPGTGVLYVAYSDGYVQALIVDGPKLHDGPNAWPKYQRTMGNAGNDDTGFFPTNWACP